MNDEIYKIVCFLNSKYNISHSHNEAEIKCILKFLNNYFNTTIEYKLIDGYYLFTIKDK